MTFELDAVGQINKLEKRITRLESLEGGLGIGTGFTLIDEIVLPDSLQTSVELEIPDNTFQSLCILLSVRYVDIDDQGSSPLYLRMNGDEDASYDWGYRVGALVGYTTALLDTQIELGEISCLGVGEGPVYFASLEGWIVHHSDGDKITPITWMSGCWFSENGGDDDWRDFKGSGHWRNTLAITGLEFFGGTFEINSKFSLYGIGV